MVKYNVVHHYTYTSLCLFINLYTSHTNLILSVVLACLHYKAVINKIHPDNTCCFHLSSMIIKIRYHLFHMFVLYNIQTFRMD